MSYDIHIHRREEWLDEGNDITLDEWKALIAHDKSLVPDGHVNWKPKDGGDSYETPAATWTAPDGSKGGFYWYNGEITVGSPTQAVATKAYELAQMLSARVQGDDFEFYGPDGSVLQ
jgi:hypothetical protein